MDNQKYDFTQAASSLDEARAKWAHMRAKKSPTDLQVYFGWEDAKHLPVEERPICFRLPGDLFHASHVCVAHALLKLFPGQERTQEQKALIKPLIDDLQLRIARALEANGYQYKPPGEAFSVEDVVKGAVKSTILT